MNKYIQLKSVPLEERLWARIDKRSKDECWNWLGGPKSGYGKIKKPRQKVSSPAHRIAYELTYGPIVTGLDVCHKCDNVRCCNPNHLFLGTNQDNMKDMLSKNRSAGQKGTRFQPKVNGSNNGRAKLSAKQVDFIRSYGRSWSTLTLALQFGVSRSTINRILRGSSWTK